MQDERMVVSSPAVHMVEVNDLDLENLRGKRAREMERELPAEMERSMSRAEGTAKYENQTDGRTSATSKHSFLRLPDLIDMLAKEGQVIQWDDAACVYEVINGPMFEEKFNALRCTRGKRKEQAMERPFARMHSHFVLVSGGRWGGTGSTFRPIGKAPPRAHRLLAAKDGDYSPCVSDPCGPQGIGSPSSSDHDNPMSVSGCRQGMVNAEMVNISLSGHPEEPSSRIQCTLQHFLDVTGAGDLYQRAMRGKLDCFGTDAPLAAAQNPDLRGTVVPNFGGPYAQLPMRGPNGMEITIPDGILNERDIASIVGGMWQEDSLGDQGYFFMRHANCDPFFNGAIVALVDGKLTRGASGDDKAIYMVVSDKNVKWKGEPLPTAEEELLGHWCAFLGQVPVRVEGAVQCGEYVGPKEDGSGLGVVTRLGEGPVVGIALGAKEAGAAGAVKTLCFAGFNALSPLGADFKQLFLQARRLESSVDDLRRGVHQCEECILSVLATVEERDERMRDLQSRIETVETGGEPDTWLDALLRHVPPLAGWKPRRGGGSGWMALDKPTLRARRKTLAVRVLIVLLLIVTAVAARGWFAQQSPPSAPSPPGAVLMPGYYGLPMDAGGGGLTAGPWMVNATLLWPVPPSELAEWASGEEYAEHHDREEHQKRPHKPHEGADAPNATTVPP